jgi:hypothetical protein
VSAAAVPPELWRDRASVSDYLLEHQQDPEVRSASRELPFYQANSYRWMNAARTIPVSTSGAVDSVGRGLID